MLTKDAFRTAIAEYLKQTGMSRTAFGTAVMKDPNFVFDLENGREVSLKTVERVSQFMASHPPDEGRAA